MRSIAHPGTKCSSSKRDRDGTGHGATGRCRLHSSTTDTSTERSTHARACGHAALLELAFHLLYSNLNVPRNSLLPAGPAMRWLPLRAMRLPHRASTPFRWSVDPRMILVCAPIPISSAVCRTSHTSRPRPHFGPGGLDFETAMLAHIADSALHELMIGLSFTIQLLHALAVHAASNTATRFCVRGCELPLAKADFASSRR